MIILSKLTVVRLPDSEHNLVKNERNGFSHRWQFSNIASHREETSEMKNQYAQYAQESIIKPTLILATLLFLLVAPAPDSQDIAEMTANFLIPDNHSGLQASEKPIKPVQEEYLE